MKKLLLILLCGVMLFGTTGCGNENVEEEKQQEQIQEFGNVEKETAEVLVAKFNTQIVDNSSLNPASVRCVSETALSTPYSKNSHKTPMVIEKQKATKAT